jgi:hypothetical protein
MISGGLVRLLRLALLAAAVAHAALRCRWLSDDAFISFRYAEHLVQGDGLVFNSGERVEGYTNFLWTLLLALGMALGVGPERSSVALGLLAYALTLALLARTGDRIAARARLPAGLGGFAALGFGAMLHARIFATGGLETSLFILLVTATLTAVAEVRALDEWLRVGLLGALCTLCRPDGALVLGGAVFFAWLGGGAPGLRGVLVAPVMLLTPWLAWKVYFYGTVIPNTFTAKAGEGARWGQGALYLWGFTRMYAPLLLGFFAVPLVTRRMFVPRVGWGVLGYGLVSFGWVLYVARVGGDFMFARFLLPVAPALLLAVEEGLALLSSARLRLGLGALLLAALAFAPFDRRLLDDRGVDGIVEERSWYPAAQVEEARRQGGVLAPMLEGTPVKAVYFGTQAMLAYYSRVPYALEPHVGLTDALVARLPTPDGARTGHGRKAGPAYLRERGIDLAFDFRMEMPHPPGSRVDFGEGVTATLVRYHQPLVEVLRGRGAVVEDLPAWMDQTLPTLPNRSAAERAQLWAHLEGFYFAHNDDPERLAAWRAATMPPAGALP